MFTWSVNSEITKVTGVISPCQRPSQKPAGSVPVSTASLGPAAQPARTTRTPTSSATETIRDLVMGHLRRQPTPSGGAAIRPEGPLPRGPPTSVHVLRPAPPHH